jgi:recombination protein RecA
MKSAAVTALESLLETRRFDHTLIKPWSVDAPIRVVPTGLAALDQALGGGWRQGEVSELVGPPTSGRTSVSVAALAAVTAVGGLGAVVDAMDRFDPRAAREAGCDLERVLWVRGPSLTTPVTPAVIGRALRQAIRACDLIVRAGGFSLVVLDVADVPARMLRSLPLTTWMRLARVNEGRTSACLLLGPLPVGRSARGVTVHLSAASRWDGTSAQSRRLSGLTAEATIHASHALFGTTTFTLGCTPHREGSRHDLLPRQ